MDPLVMAVSVIGLVVAGTICVTWWIDKLMGGNFEATTKQIIEDLKEYDGKD